MPNHEFTVVAILYPKKGKAGQLVELLQGVSKHVRDNEPGTLKYEIHRSLRPGKDGAEDVIMVERYRDQTSLQTHASSAPFLEFQKQVKDLDLVRAPMTLKMVSVQGGFASRL